MKKIYTLNESEREQFCSQIESAIKTIYEAFNEMSELAQKFYDFSYAEEDIASAKHIAQRCLWAMRKAVYETPITGLAFYNDPYRCRQIADWKEYLDALKKYGAIAAKGLRFDGEPLHYNEVIALAKYAIEKGYKSQFDFPEDEVIKVVDEENEKNRETSAVYRIGSIGCWRNMGEGKPEDFGDIVINREDLKGCEDEYDSDI